MHERDSLYRISAVGLPFPFSPSFLLWLERSILFCSHRPLVLLDKIDKGDGDDGTKSRVIFAFVWCGLLGFYFITKAADVCYEPFNILFFLVSI